MVGLCSEGCEWLGWWSNLTKMIVIEGLVSIFGLRLEISHKLTVLNVNKGN